MTGLDRGISGTNRKVIVDAVIRVLGNLEVVVGMKGLSNFLSTAAGLFTSAAFGFILTLALAYPANCYRNVNGDLRWCGDYVTCLNERSVSNLQASSFLPTCKNFLGWPAFVDYGNEATVIAFVVAAICAGIAWLIGNTAKSNNA